jgi:hypothetical protein
MIELLNCLFLMEVKMKKFIATLMFMACINGASAAGPVFLYPTCSYGPAGGECTLFNSSGKDISCNIHARAQTQRGSYITAYDYRILYQGQFAWVRVYANNPQMDPIVYINATAFCNELY